MQSHRARGYNVAIMRKLIALVFTALVFAVGCSRSGSPSKFHDAVQNKLVEIAGKDASDCGRLDQKAEAQAMSNASNCAMQAAHDKHAFYVAYDLPGMTIAVAGNAQGQLFSIQSEPAQNSQPGALAPVQSMPCPSDIRVAPSGRISCFAPGMFGSSSMGGSSHGMPMGTPGMENPHGGTMPPAGTPNPHGTKPPEPPKQQ